MTVKEENIYTWPNKAFPFRLLLDSRECRIFILENIAHNYKWLKKYKNKIRENDFFFVILGWNLSEYLAEHSRFTIDSLGLRNENFFILYNCHEEKRNGQKFNLNGKVINHNAWLEPSRFKPKPIKKKYDALYIARPSEFKNHNFASKINNLALAAGGNAHGPALTSLPKSKNDPTKMLNKNEIIDLINESRCGLCLSTEEGSCYSSSEYLLCGVPVVSVKSKGGRDVWYSSENSIICEPNAEAVSEAVNIANDREWDAELIRSNHINQANHYKNIFIDEIQKKLDRFNFSKSNARDLFESNFDWYCRSSVDSTGEKTSNIEKLGYFFGS